MYFHRKQLKHGQEGVEVGSDLEIKWAAHLLQVSTFLSSMILCDEYIESIRSIIVNIYLKQIIFLFSAQHSRNQKRSDHETNGNHYAIKRKHCESTQH